MVHYCEEDDLDEDCIFCPKAGVCKDGELTTCSKGFTMIRNEVCVEESKYEDLVLEMTGLALDLSASMNGRNLCYAEG
jgi:hypothetical protein